MNTDPLSAIQPPLHAAAGERLTPSARKATPAELAKAAQQFEAIMVRQLLAPAIEPMMNGGSLGGEGSQGGGGVYGYMLTDVLANSISQGGGLGLAGVITSQLGPAPAAKLP
jgi:flagellar protein FlgJ